MARTHEMRDWQSLLREAQDEIAALDPHPYYVRAYRAAESSYWRCISKWLFERRGSRRIARVLDIGCGYGTLALFCKKLFECEVYCTDVTNMYISTSLLDKYHLIFALNNIELDPFPWQQCFELVIFTEVIEHLNFFPVPTLERIRRLQSEDGEVYLSTPDASAWGRVTKYYSSLHELPEPARGSPFIDDHVYHYNESELRGVVAQAGLRVAKFDYSPGVAGRHFNLVLTRQ